MAGSVRLARLVAQRLVEIQGMDRAMALAGQAFAALLPLLIIVGAASREGGRDLTDRLITAFDLEGDTARTLRDSVADPAAVEESITALSVAFLVISGLSFTRALQRLYERAWRLDTLGVRGNSWGLLWLVGFSSYIAVFPAVRGRFDATTGVAVALAASVLLWLLTPWVLLGRRLAWRRLVPQAALTATGITGLLAGSVLWMPRAVASSAGQFGFIGVGFALLSWLFAAGVVLVVCAAAGATLADARRGRP